MGAVAQISGKQPLSAGPRTPGPAFAELHDVGPGAGVNPPRHQKTIVFAPVSPPIQAEIGRFAARGGAFCEPAAPNRVSPATTWISVSAKVYIWCSYRKLGGVWKGHRMIKKIAASIAAGLMIIADLFCPDIEIGASAIVLLIIVFIPWGSWSWIASLIESAKLPGGWEIKFRNMPQLTSDVVPPTDSSPDRTPTLLEVAQFDAELALVYLRIEIERRLRALAKVVGLNQRRGLIHLFRELRRSEEINHPLFSVLQEVVTRKSSGTRSQCRTISQRMGYGIWAPDHRRPRSGS